MKLKHQFWILCIYTVHPEESRLFTHKMASTWSYILFFIILLKSIKTIESCSCKLDHPQEHYCTAHYVITARIKGIKSDHFKNYYSIKLNKIYKANAESKLALAARKIYSPIGENMCGVKLVKGKNYLFAGRTINNELRVSLCDYHEEWKNLTVKQKKSWKLLYQKGCNSCQVVPCHWWHRKNCGLATKSTCPWTTLDDGKLDCERLESVCMTQASGLCGWNMSLRYRQCLKLSQEEKERRRNLEP